MRRLVSPPNTTPPAVAPTKFFHCRRREERTRPVWLPLLRPFGLFVLDADRIDPADIAVIVGRMACLIPQKLDEAKFVCPSFYGGKLWMASSYNPASKTLFVPLNNLCMDYKTRPTTGPFESFLSCGKHHLGRVQSLAGYAVARKHIGERARRSQLGPSP
jgi:hypothetical protein